MEINLGAIRHSQQNAIWLNSEQGPRQTAWPCVPLLHLTSFTLAWFPWSSSPNYHPLNAPTGRWSVRNGSWSQAFPFLLPLHLSLLPDEKPVLGGLPPFAYAWVVSPWIVIIRFVMISNSFKRKDAKTSQWPELDLNNNVAQKNNICHMYWTTTEII